MNEIRQRISPGALDALINGRKVYINRRPADNMVYATIHDFEPFGVKPLKIVRVPISELNPEKHPDVIHALERARYLQGGDQHGPCW